MKTKTYRRALVALLTALVIGAGVATQAPAYLSATQGTELDIAGSRGGMSTLGRESA
jgi:hypothetical protein